MHCIGSRDTPAAHAKHTRKLMAKRPDVVARYQATRLSSQHCLLITNTYEIRRNILTPSAVPAGSSLTPCTNLLYHVLLRRVRASHHHIKLFMEYDNTLNSHLSTSNSKIFCYLSDAQARNFSSRPRHILRTGLFTCEQSLWCIRLPCVTLC